MGEESSEGGDEDGESSAASRRGEGEVGSVRRVEEEKVGYVVNQYEVMRSLVWVCAEKERNPRGRRGGRVALQYFLSWFLGGDQKQIGLRKHIKN